MGILALRPLPEMQATWMPVIEALNKTLTHHQISPHFLDHQEMIPSQKVTTPFARRSSLIGNCREYLPRRGPSGNSEDADIAL